jgi:hypothetical protein
MIDNSLNIAEDTTSAKQSKGGRVEQASLESADLALERIKANKTVTHSDRQVFATNLGRIADRIDVTLSDIFKRAFGAQWESFYKKRRSLVIKPDEIFDSSKLRASPRDYLLLVDAISKIDSFPTETQKQEDRYRLTLLRFIDGSSYDDSSFITEISDLDHKQEITEQIDKVINRLLGSSEIDLDWMYGRLQSSNNRDQTMSYSKVQNTDCDAPSVRLANVYTRHESPRTLKFHVSTEKMQQILLSHHTYLAFDHRRFYDEPLKELTAEELSFPRPELINSDVVIMFLLDKYGGKDSYTWDDVDDLEEAFDEVALFDHLPKAEGLYIDDFDYTYKSWLDLEVKYDDQLSKWRPLIIWRRGVSQESEDYMGYMGPDSAFGVIGNDNWDRNGHGFLIPPFASRLDNFSVICRWWTSGRHGYLFEVLEIPLNNDPESDFMSDMKIRGLPFHPPWNKNWESVLSSGAYERFIMSSIQEYNSLIEPINYYHGFVPAPKKSIAEAILQNLAYGDPEERIDNLLLEDAKTKYTQLREIAKEDQKKYREAINNL